MSRHVSAKDGTGCPSCLNSETSIHRHGGSFYGTAEHTGGWQRQWFPHPTSPVTILLQPLGRKEATAPRQGWWQHSVCRPREFAESVALCCTDTGKSPVAEMIVRLTRTHHWPVLRELRMKGTHFIFQSKSALSTEVATNCQTTAFTLDGSYNIGRAGMQVATTLSRVVTPPYAAFAWGVACKARLPLKGCSTTARYYRSAARVGTWMLRTKRKGTRHSLDAQANCMETQPSRVWAVGLTWRHVLGIQDPIGDTEDAPEALRFNGRDAQHRASPRSSVECSFSLDSRAEVSARLYLRCGSRAADE